MINNYPYTFQLDACVFHSPSQHTIDGKQYDAEFLCEFVISGQYPDSSMIDPNRINWLFVSVLLETHDHKTDFHALS